MIRMLCVLYEHAIAITFLLSQMAENYRKFMDAMWKGAVPGKYCAITSAGIRQGALVVARVETDAESFIHVRVRSERGIAQSPLTCKNVNIKDVVGPRDPPGNPFTLAKPEEMCQFCACNSHVQN